MFRNCRKACEWRYIQELVPLERDHNLAFGTVIHKCLEIWHGGRDLGLVLDFIDRTYPNRAQEDERSSIMRDTHTLRTYYDGSKLTLRYDGATAHFDLWIPGEADPEPIATIPAIGGELEWTPSGRELLDGSYAEDLQHLIDSYAELAGDRRRHKLYKKWYVWDRRLY